VVVKKSATVGAVMQPGTELFRMMRGDEVEWRAELPDQVLDRIVPGSAVRVMLGQGRSIEGRVRLVAPTVDARTRNGLVFVSLPGAGALRAGAHAQGEIRIGSVQGLTLPASAVLIKDGQSFVYVVGEQGVARATRVVTGERQDGRIEVQGLDPAARVVATGAGFVKDGERVRIATPLAAGVAMGARS
jgi:RND family efflux transporter MFP subunit